MTGRGRSRISAALVALVPTVPAAGLGCEDAPIPETNRATQTAADCSFTAAGPHDVLSGFPARDIGNGKVAFRLADGGTCGPLEQHVFVDCTSGQSIAIKGVMDPVTVAYLKRTGTVRLGVDARITFIQRPYGAVALTGESTVEAVKDLSDRHGYTMRNDLVDWIATVRRKDRLDLFCGCKLYYPNSPGAQE